MLDARVEAVIDATSESAGDSKSSSSSLFLFQDTLLSAHLNIVTSNHRLAFPYCFRSNVRIQRDLPQNILSSPRFEDATP